MLKWSQKVSLAVLNLGLIAMSPNVAGANEWGAYDSSCEPCENNACNDSCMSGFELSVDFLYWKTCIDDLTYASSVSVLEPTATPDVGVASRDVEYHNICPNWKPGFRINLAKNDICGGLTLEGSYTWLKSKGSSSVSRGACGSLLVVDDGSYVESPLIHPLYAGLPGSAVNHYARGCWEGTYQNWDALLSFELCGNKCHSFNPFFGVAGLIFDQSFDVVLAPTCGSGNIGALRMSWDNNFFGVGLKAGSLYTYEICEQLSLFAKGSISIVTGNSDNKYNRNRQDAYGQAGSTVPPLPGVLGSRLNFYDDDCCQFIPGWHLQLGINYKSEFCGCESNIHLGWEYQLWDNIANPRRFTGNPSGIETGSPVTALSASDIVSYAGQSSLTTLGFHGLFVGIDFDF